MTPNINLTSNVNQARQAADRASALLTASEYTTDSATLRSAAIDALEEALRLLDADPEDHE